MTRALALVAALLALPAFAQEVKKRTPAEVSAQLKVDLQKTDRALALTELQIGKSRAAAYLPELQFRLAELYVERSRYLYLLQRTESGLAGDTSQVAPEVRLAKQKALSIYQRILRDFPDWPGTDRTRFYMAHEYRELGEFERMIATEEELAEKNPDSPLASEGLLIVGDHWFASKDLAKAEVAYQRVLARPPAPVRDLAAFKMGWVRFNQGKHDGAVKYFEEAASSPLLDGASADVLNVKREALFDLVFSFTESRPWQGSVAYFEKLSPSSAVYAGVLEKLANRYFIKQEWQAAVVAYRRLLELSRDPSRALDSIGRLHEAIKAGGELTQPQAGDVKAAVRLAARVRTEERLDAAQRKAALDELEVTSRDLATRMLIAARAAKTPDKATFAAAAEAHGAWLSLYRDSPHHAEMQRNQADALFAAGRWHESALAYERVALLVAAKDQEEPLYDALAAHARAAGEPLRLSPWERTDALRAMALLGAQYVSRFPASERVATVKFNVARAAYDEGDWKRAAALFLAYTAEHPKGKDARAASLLVLDALHSLGDYDALEVAGKKLAAEQALPESVRKEVAETLARTRTEQLSAVALQSSARGGDAAKGLLELADKQKGTELGEKALHAAFTTYRDNHDDSHLAEVATRFLAAYPRSPLAVDVLTTQARIATERADLDGAAAAYEALSARFPNEAIGQDAALTSAALRELLGDPKRAVASLEGLPVSRRQGRIGRKLAQARLESGDAAGAEAMTLVLLKADSSDAEAAVLQSEALLAQGQALAAAKASRAAIKAARKRGEGDALARLWDLAGEASLRLLLAAPPDPLETQVALLKSVQEASSAVAQLRAGELVVKGVYRLAVSFDALARTLAAAPAPAQLPPEDQQRYLAALQQQSAGLRAQSQETFKSCSQKARELDVFAPFVLACAKGERLAPEAALTAPAPTQAATSAAIVAARARLAKKPADAEALEVLGVAQLQAGDLRRARLSLQRAAQVDAARASAHAALGVSLARLDVPSAARDEYRRALELDPTLDRALAGLAALKCRFGDVDGAKPLLARMRGKVDPGAADADPELAKCGGKP